MLDVFATWATVVLTALLKSAPLDLTCSSATVTRKAATALVVASVITRAVSASASLDTSVPSASTRLFLVKKKEHDAFSHFLDSDIKDAGKAKVGNVENLLRDKSNRTRMMSRSPKYTHQPPQLL
jgi:hypothetical protein